MKLFALLSICLFSLSGARADDFAIIKEKLRIDQMINEPQDLIPTWKLQDLNTWLQTQEADGTWKDVDYADVNGNTFPPVVHLSRMSALSQAYATPGHTLHQNKMVSDAIWKAYDHWVAKDYQSYNWWNNTIGVPLQFERAMILLENELTPKRKTEGLNFLGRASIGGTGQNLLWFSEVVLTHGLLSNDQTEVKRALEAIQSEIDISRGEGIQSDYSFHQHGELIYSGGYGAGFAISSTRFIALTQGTFAQFSQEKFDLIGSYLLDGSLWMTRADKFDYSVVGREIARKGHSANKLRLACQLMASAPSARQAEFKNCADSIEQKRASGLSGNRYFRESDFMVHQRKDFYVSARMYSKRMLNNDAPSNGEGLLSHHLADGATFILKDGSEYQDIFPVWDWRKIPGTTVEQKTLKPAEYVPGHSELFAHIRYYGESSFVGGVTDGDTGIAAMDFISNKTYEKVDARKSWFFFDRGFVALGNSIRCETHCKEVNTTLDQSLLKSPIRVLSGDQFHTLEKKQESSKDIQAILHRGVGFVFPQGQSVTVSGQTQKGAWDRINKPMGNAPVEADVFSAWIDHGANPKNESYAYVAFLQTNEKEVRKLASKLPMQILNTEDLQAVYHPGKKMLQAVFYKAGEVRFGSTFLKVNAPCLIMVKGKRMYVSDPTQKLNHVKVKYLENADAVTPSKKEKKSGKGLFGLSLKRSDGPAAASEETDEEAFEDDSLTDLESSVDEDKTYSVNLKRADGSSVEVVLE